MPGLFFGQAGNLSTYQFRGVKTGRSFPNAFTLIELLVVIAVIAILAAFKFVLFVSLVVLGFQSCSSYPSMFIFTSLFYVFH